MYLKGSIILEFLEEENESLLKNKILDSCFTNLKQIHNYMINYQNEYGKLDQEDFELFNEKVNVLSQKFRNYKQYSIENIDNEDFFKLVSQIKETMHAIKNKYREIWTEFNLKLMYIGVFILVCSILAGISLFHFIDYNIQTKCQFLEDFNFFDEKKSIVFMIRALFLFFGLITIAIVYEIEFLLIFSVFTFIFSLFFLYLCYINIGYFRNVIQKKESKFLQIKSIFLQNKNGAFIFWLLQISHGYMLFAVSHIRNEGQAILFILYIVNLFYCYLCWKNLASTSDDKKKYILNIILISFILYFTSFYESNVLSKTDITLKKVTNNNCYK